MPVNEKQTSGEILYQRQIYERGGISRWYWDYKDRIILQNLSKSDQTIYDIGCGEGILLEKICHITPDRNVMGIDYMAENVTICHKYGLPARQGDLYALNIPDASADIVFLIEVIEHLRDYKNALRELARIIKPGGKLIILFPHDSVFAFARFATFKFKEWKYDAGHIKQWTYTDLTKELSPLGMKTIYHRFIPFIFWGISLHGLCISVKGL